MSEGYQSLTEKEKQTLRLLLSGYDAKSMARYLGLSVHTINERLRDARRKLAVSSSREAARLVREAEGVPPELFADRLLGDAPLPVTPHPSGHPGHGSRTVRRTGLMIGGVMMSMALALYAAVALLGGETHDAGSAGASPAVSEPTQTVAEQAARRWLELVDARNWEASWAATGSAFRQANSRERWSAAAAGAHGAMGAAQSRELVSADYSPAPPNGVWTLRFRSRFAGPREVIETVALGYEDGGWKVVGLMLD